jgi:hypothetical protein
MRPQFIMSAHTPSPRDRGACHRSPSRLRASIPLAGAIPVVALLATGCSSGSASSVTTDKVSSAAVAASTAAASTPASTTTAPATATASDLTGTWNGTYNGSYSGTFTVKWTQSGAKVDGTIALPSVGTTEQLNGTVSGDKITFGTVGSFAVTYSGTFSGSSMSGTYNVTGSPAGNWSATKA